MKRIGDKPVTSEELRLFFLTGVMKGSSFSLECDRRVCDVAGRWTSGVKDPFAGGLLLSEDEMARSLAARLS